METQNIKRVAGLAIVGVCLLVVLIFAGSVVENVDADEIVVIQDPIDGELHWYTTAGLKLQMFGKVTRYPKRDIYRLEEVRIRFNDAAHATVRGSIQFEYPLAVADLTDIHTRYGSAQAVAEQVMKTTVDKVIYMTGPLMSSRESYAEKRTDLINYVQDQIDNGIYRVGQREDRTIDPISGEERTVVLAEIVVDANGQPRRQESSIVGEFGIRAFNFAIDELAYDPTVETQIQQQQELTMAVQTAIAESRTAEQQALTAEQRGRARAAESRWEQEVVKAKAVTEAEQKRDVARLASEEAEFYKREQTLRGEGESTYKRLVMNADGALAQKLDAYVKTQQLWAGAFQHFGGQLVPSLVMGQQGGSAQNGVSTAQQFMDLLTAQAARDLSLDMRVPKGNDK